MTSKHLQLQAGGGEGRIYGGKGRRKGSHTQSHTHPSAGPHYLAGHQLHTARLLAFHLPLLGPACVAGVLQLVTFLKCLSAANNSLRGRPNKLRDDMKKTSSKFPGRVDSSRAF